MPLDSGAIDGGIMKRFALPLLVVLLLAGCSTSERTNTTNEDKAAPTVSPSPAASAAPSVTPTPTLKPAAEAVSDPADLTSQVRAASPELESYVESATLTQPGRVTV